MKLKRISYLKKNRGIKETKRKILLERRNKLIEEMNDINHQLHLGRKLGLSEALAKIYNVNLSKKGKTVIGCKISVPLCLANKKVKLRLVENE